MGGKKLGVFVDDWRRGNPDLEQASDRLLRSAPSNDLIPPSYESMILARHPEERARQRQLERERERKLEKERERVREIQRQKEKQEERERKAELARRAMAELEASAAKETDAAAQPAAKGKVKSLINGGQVVKRVRITGGDWKGELCTVLEDKGDEVEVDFQGARYTVSKTGRGGVMVTDAPARPELHAAQSMVVQRPKNADESVRSHDSIGPQPAAKPRSRPRSAQNKRSRRDELAVAAAEYDQEAAVAAQDGAIVVETTQQIRERMDSANDPFRSLLSGRAPPVHSERVLHPLLGPLPPEESRRAPSRGPTPGTTTPSGSRGVVPRDKLGFTPSVCPGSAISASSEFLEGWVQFGVQRLRSGEPLPPLASGLNPSRVAGLQAASGRKILRKSVASVGALGLLSQPSTPEPLEQRRQSREAQRVQSQEEKDREHAQHLCVTLAFACCVVPDSDVLLCRTGVR
eukprot:COSAG04_NODE_285_length_18117_cov_10.869797_7_plen_463_part_00